MQARAVGQQSRVYSAEWYGMLNRVDWASASQLSSIQERKWLAIKKPNVVFGQRGSHYESW